MPIYFIYFAYVWEKLYPPHLRLSLHLAWGFVLTKPLQWLRDLTFEIYTEGAPYLYWDFSTAYLTGDRVYYNDRGVYEALQNSTGTFPDVAPTFWRKILDNHIGVRERMRYNSQKLLFEFALNRWFDIDVSANPPIYITNNAISTSPFLMGQSGQTSSTMARNSINSLSYMGNTPSYNSDAFTIYVPILVFNTLASNNTDRENIIRNFADRYKIAGIQYNVVTY